MTFVSFAVHCYPSTSRPTSCSSEIDKCNDSTCVVLTAEVRDRLRVSFGTSLLLPPPTLCICPLRNHLRPAEGVLSANSGASSQIGGGDIRIDHGQRSAKRGGIPGREKSTTIEWLRFGASRRGSHWSRPSSGVAESRRSGPRRAFAGLWIRRQLLVREHCQRMPDCTSLETSVVASSWRCTLR